MSGTPKKLINDPQNVVEEMVQGIVASHPSLVRIEGYHVLLRYDYLEKRTSQVAVISGGGSGHEPAHAGFIGPGMLSAAVCGGVFASPSVDSILAAIRSVSTRGGPGCLLIVKNYTGDRLNFGLACEQSKSEGIPCEMVIVGDDVAVNAGDEDDGTITGRRGLAGTLFVHKCAGAAAEKGMSLKEVTKAAQEAANAVGSMGVALTTCTVPGSEPSSRIGSDEMELGLGIHNEPGRTKTKVQPVNKIVQQLISEIDNIMKLSKTKLSESSETKQEGEPKTKGKAVALMINNLGGTPLLELYVAANAAHKCLDNLDITISRTYIGSFMTSLEMQGMMITICKVDENRLELLDAATGALAWPKTEYNNMANSCVGRKGGRSGRVVSAPIEQLVGAKDVKLVEMGNVSEVGKRIQNGLKAAASVLVENEDGKLTKHSKDETALSVLTFSCLPFCSLSLSPSLSPAPCSYFFLFFSDTELTRLDSIVGDGDCGITFKRGALAILEDLESYPVDSPSMLCSALGNSVRKSMGGSSGAILDIMFRAASTNFKTWPEALSNGVESASYYGGAKVGYRTMLDALIPASITARNGGTWKEIVASAEQGVINTRSMRPLAGRSSYLKQEDTNGTEDPGAAAVAMAMKAFSVAYQET
jgi:dihydroxyacetone kinase